MENLASSCYADNSIFSELLGAGIPEVNVPRNKGVVSYTLMGKLGGWDFKRDWIYWVATAKEGDGLPLKVANELHNKTYPPNGDDSPSMFRKPQIYGEVILVDGIKEISPFAWALKNEMANYEKLRAQGIEVASTEELARFCKEGLIKDYGSVRLYHVYTQEGLNEFARVVESLHQNCLKLSQ